MAVGLTVGFGVAVGMAVGLTVGFGVAVGSGVGVAVFFFNVMLILSCGSSVYVLPASSYIVSTAIALFTLRPGIVFSIWIWFSLNISVVSIYSFT